MDEIVSVIIPCYNCSNTVERAINSVISQKYRPLEVIVVNDGSTDNTHDLIQNIFCNIIDEKVYVKYVRQENMGLGGAINTGLKYVTGDYLVWIDSDDELLANSIYLRVEYLRSHPEIACVTSDAYIVSETNWDVPIGKVSDGIKNNSDKNQFEHLLHRKSIFCCGCHMLRTSLLWKVNPYREIYPARHGQNWQMLLPVFYKYKRGFLDIPLYKYGVSATNMTAELNKLPAMSKIQREMEYKDIVFNTIDSIPQMPNNEKKKYKRDFAGLTYLNSFHIALENSLSGQYLKYTLLLCITRKYSISLFIYSVKKFIKRIVNR